MYWKYLFLFAAFLGTTLDYASTATPQKLQYDVNRNVGPVYDKNLQLGVQSFDSNLYLNMASVMPEKSFVYSPISLYTILALLYVGAENNTRFEIGQTLGLPLDNDLMYKQFDQLLKTQQPKGIELKIATKLYVREELNLQPTFEEVALKHFDAAIEPVNFEQKQDTADKINSWVAAQTHNRIQQLIQAATLKSDAYAMFVNAIYLKANWSTPFNEMDTLRREFEDYAQRKTMADMMFQEEYFRYANIKELGAKVLELPYANSSNMSMLLVLPNAKNGLRAMEQKMGQLDLRTWPESLREENVQVLLPRFRVDFDMDMTWAIKKLGIMQAFSNRAELNNIFGRINAGISKVQHKAYIKVNERGTEAAAATGYQLVPLSLPSNQKKFWADHPFMFIIRSPQAVYFMGHVVNI